jgi:hypothetical protein
MRPMPWATSSAGATASMAIEMLPPNRRTRQMPASTAIGIAPQMPRPPSHTASTPYQTCGM